MPNTHGRDCNIGIVTDELNWWLRLCAKYHMSWTETKFIQIGDHAQRGHQKGIDRSI